ncbi:MAG: iron-containing alcohol dehydrogenase, partial [Treponema sp.]|nr:iron-containing alcohol dehydrogenase [Treponema sp.]
MENLHRPLVDIGHNAFDRLIDFLGERGRPSLRIVADGNTWRAAGETLASMARGAGLDLVQTVYDDLSLVADARSVLKLLVEEEDRKRLFVAVGSGTITDIVRFAAHRTGRDFISVPTAASVDAYGSVVAPLVIGGVKRTVGAAAPLAIFADTEVLAAAPRPMTSAGFGDMLCKYSAVADWRLGALLWGESYDVVALA